MKHPAPFRRAKDLVIGVLSPYLFPLYLRTRFINF
jgi:hypothetical protein